MHRIALFGEILADIFPNYTVLGGAPYNVARHLHALQQQPVLISRTGDDALKDQLFTELNKLKLDVSGIQLDPIYPTGQVTVHLENDGHRFEINADQAYDHIHAGDTKLKILAVKPDFAYFGTLVQRSAESQLALDAFLNHVDCPRFLDINLRDPWYNKQIIQYSLSQADIVKINDDELKTVCDVLHANVNNQQARAHYLVETFNLNQLFVTCGEHGAWALSNHAEKPKIEETKIAIQPLTSPLVDTVGAGDAFAAICIIGLFHHWPMEAILIRASQFASAVCTIKGAAPENSDFYHPYIKSWF